MNDFDIAYNRAVSRDRIPRQKRMRDQYKGRSAGKPKSDLLLKIKELIKSGTYDEWDDDGFDDYRVECIDFDASAEAVVKFLKERGVIKHLL
jgi:hypothetical protein